MNVACEDITLFQLERFKLFVKINAEIVSKHYKNYSQYGFYWNRNWHTHANCNYATSYRPMPSEPIMRGEFFVIGSLYNPNDAPREQHVLYDTNHGLCSAHVPDFLFDEELSDEDVKDTMVDVYQRQYIGFLTRIKTRNKNDIIRAQSALKEVDRYEKEMSN